MGRHAASRTVRPRTVVIGMVAVVVIVAAAVGLSLLLRERHPGAVNLRGPHGDSPVSYAGIFPAEDDEPLANPLGIAYDGEYLYVAESDAGVIRIFDENGGRVGTIDVPVAKGQRSAYPSSIAVAGDRLAVVDNAANRVVLLSRDVADGGASVEVLGDGDDEPAQPTVVAYAQGEFFVADASDDTIRVYGGDARFLRAFGPDEVTPAGFITALAVSGDLLYAADSGAGLLLACNVKNGDPEGPLGGEYSLPRAIVPITEDALVVIDGLGRSAHIVDRAGIEFVSIDADTLPEGLMSAPHGATWIAGDGRLYVTDAGTGRVNVYNIQVERL